MFSKILVPTDGSVLGTIAALEGISMAAKLGAEVVGINIAREYAYAGFGKKVTPEQAEYEAAAKEASSAKLKVLADAAAKAGVKFSSVQLIINRTGLAIVSTAEEKGCDLIFIGSHGCAGWDSVLMGSVSNKVLATAKVPVLVYRVKESDVPADVPQGYESVFPPI